MRIELATKSKLSNSEVNQLIVTVWAVEKLTPTRVLEIRKSHPRIRGVYAESWVQWRKTKKVYATNLATVVDYGWELLDVCSTLLDAAIMGDGDYRNPSEQLQSLHQWHLLSIRYCEEFYKNQARQNAIEDEFKYLPQLHEEKYTRALKNAQLYTAAKKGNAPQEKIDKIHADCMIDYNRAKKAIASEFAKLKETERELLAYDLSEEVE